MRRLALVFAAACGPGNVPADYAPAALQALGLHNAPTYVARDVSLPDGILLAHPRLGQPAIRMANETFDVMWLEAPPSGALHLATDATGPDPAVVIDGVATPVAPSCDADRICHATASAPAASGLHQLCIVSGGRTACSMAAIDVVGAYSDPLAVVHFSDAHIGADDDAAVLDRVVDQINGLAPDLAVFTGDACDTGTAAQRTAFLAALARLRVPVFVITGNHDYDAGGIDGWLVDVGPELDYIAPIGGIQLAGVSSGQDLDDGNHDTTISESSGPDRSQLHWLDATLGDAPAIVALHHPIYNPLFATVGPDARDRLKSIVTRAGVRAVLAGHTHISAVFDADGDSRGLSLDADTVDSARWPLHYIASRATRDPGGVALLHLGTSRVDYRWLELP